MKEISKSSRDALKGVNPTLVKIVEQAFQDSEVEMNVSEGLRTKERQAQLVAEGKSKKTNSKHLDGIAVDIYPLTDDRKKIDYTKFEVVATLMKESAKKVGAKIIWGGDWKSIDKPHFELA